MQAAMFLAKSVNDANGLPLREINYTAAILDDGQGTESVVLHCGVAGIAAHWQAVAGANNVYNASS